MRATENAMDPNIIERTDEPASRITPYRPERTAVSIARTISGDSFGGAYIFPLVISEIRQILHLKSII